MTSAVLSIGSNLGDRLGQLQSVVTGLGGAVQAISPVYETDAWGGVEQGPFLNAVLLVDDADLDGPGWLRRAHEFENAADRLREQRWGPRTLDVDIVSCHDNGAELRSDDPTLTLPHPLAHQRAFVLVPWLAADPDATLTVDGRSVPVAELLAALDAGERGLLAAVRRTDLVLVP
ncbi:2-amino-4-hydroxy-6-hydroxymethyldihydropteridine diphosphokinase [Mycobacterium sp. CBMA293]|uniref:2-amino-4-hydroxy-6- hydroxymethyldihydropteridine diphosphokinase n=1 Tax=unclassified Mycolicibacterium TaxID=2636767 RepID=UPI0012DFC94F|nr:MULTISPECIES: 2-amino-4-hydroxy-6-hydroxymethyldihydropteridine diphosphokinase [unclassified Mycolicibacterium]MUL46129.1 2-amino-4-hydroxy-6-hydroxymethyldihydropteridine diphosphokinase [Mycolicibacterium sp. CBMA 360]MUL58822.1 2-amino-4-hydroxy-6-hydroxymethyldihydropteridine diphosphokinase [Mycolicibacterium sp. CBMA 335]MUL69216.1 2-amino-4-hydroxy-6-hydroxymethyldihydropteridine diphosphokinase [Mycolicibacterium sp. CBMA 311]MUL94180.1 2-amino-4-hydroxy-6-hydroxymethyldihydropterid